MFPGTRKEIGGNDGKWSLLCIMHFVLHACFWIIWSIVFAVEKKVDLNLIYATGHAISVIRSTCSFSLF
jgi:hypothetical protein